MQNGVGNVGDSLQYSQVDNTKFRSTQSEYATEDTVDTGFKEQQLRFGRSEVGWLMDPVGYQNFMDKKSRLDTVEKQNVGRTIEQNGKQYVITGVKQGQKGYIFDVQPISIQGLDGGSKQAGISNENWLAKGFMKFLELFGISFDANKNEFTRDGNTYSIRK